MVWKFTTDDEFSVKTAHGSIMTLLALTLKQNSLVMIGKSILVPKVKLFAWKLVHNILLIRDKVRYYGTDIIGKCPFCNNESKTIDHIFVNCDLAYNIWYTINYYCPNPINKNLNNIDWLEHIWIYRNWYNEVFRNAFGMSISILWPIWYHRNKVVSHHHKCNLVEVIQVGNTSHVTLLSYKNINKVIQDNCRYNRAKKKSIQKYYGLDSSIAGMFKIGYVSRTLIPNF